jgi:hypothetical protein
MTDRELMEMALDALDKGLEQVSGDYDTSIQNAIGAANALRKRLSQPEPEPVSWNGECVLGHCGSPSGCDDSGCCRAAPPSIEAAVKAEREACAKLLENGRFLHDEAPAKILAKEAAKAIRARGEK